MVVLSPVTIFALILLGAVITGFILGARLVKGWLSLSVWAAGLFILFMGYGLFHPNGQAIGIDLVLPPPEPDVLPVKAEVFLSQPGAIVSLPVEQEIEARTPPPEPQAAVNQASPPRATVQPSLVPQTEVPPSSIQDETPEPDTSSVWRFVIPSLTVDAVVKYYPLEDGTWDITGLKDNVAWLGGTSMPGLGGNTVLAGHIMVRTIGRGPFRYLDRLKPGESVVVYTERNIYTYRVREQVLVNEDDVSVVQASDHPQVTLLTCSNWDEENESYLKRRAVFADLVKVAPYQDDHEDALLK